MSRVKPKQISSSQTYIKDKEGCPLDRSIDPADLIQPAPSTSISTIILPNPETSHTSQQTVDSYNVLTFEEELARLEQEASDDLVYNALGSFHLSTPSPSGDTFEPYVHNVDIIGPRGKYTVRSAKVRDSADYHRYVRRARETSDHKGTVTADDSNSRVRDSGISSANTTGYPSSPSVFVSESYDIAGLNDRRDMEAAQDVNEMDTIRPVKLQVNGIIGGTEVTDVNGGGRAGPSRHRNPKQRYLRSDPSIHANADPGILRSELLAAVELNKVDRVRNILNAGIDPNSVCDEKGRWPLHIACLLGHPAMAKLLLDHGAQKDQPDTSLERTPLLYASATSKETVQVLLGYRADINARNKFGATALHYAAGAGQGDCCRILASSGCDVNGRDGQKMTPLLMAARVDDTWSIDILLEYGGDIHAQDCFGKTALHHAAETCEGIESDYGKMGATFRKLVSAGITVNAVDHDGKTALYYAIQTGSEDAVMILYELGAELLDGMSLLTMSKKFPHNIPPFLDKCVSSNIDNCDPESKQFYIQFDYTCLTLFPKDIPNDKLLSVQNREETESILREMGVLHGLTRCRDSSILSHPVCESLLRLKWKKVKWYLYLDMLLFAVFLAFLTAVIFMEYESDSTSQTIGVDAPENSTLEMGQDESMTDKDSSGTSHGTGHERYCMDSSRNIVVWSILWVLTAGIGIREMIQLIQAPLHYVVQVDNMLELVLVASVALLSLAECGVRSFVGARDHFAAVCLIVGWTIQVTLYGKIPVFGVYIRMFAAVSQNILKCMFTYLGLLFAFSLTLHFLFRTQKDFDSVGFTFLKTFAMMIGEVDLARTFIDSRLKNAVIVPFTSHLVVALFIIFISIILSSLFIALAVCDISSMQREGEYMQLVQQVKVSSQLEDALQKRSLLYPQFGMRDIRSLHQRKGVIFPNLKDHGKLSKDALEIVLLQHAKRLDPSRNGLVQPTLPEHLGLPAPKAPNELYADDVLQKVQEGMEKYSQDSERRMVEMAQDMKSQVGTSSLAREVLLIKGQLEDMNTCLRELNVMVKGMTTFYEEGPTPKHESRKKGKKGNEDSRMTQQSVLLPTVASPSELEPMSRESSRGNTPSGPGEGT